MKTEGSIRHKLKQVKYRIVQKAIRNGLSRKPCNCKHSGLVKGSSGDDLFYVCLLDAEKPKEWEGMICDNAVPPHCPFFKPHKTKEDVEKEVDDLSLAYGKGATGRGMATGGSKAIKDLEKEQKTRQTRMIRDGLDAALLDIATFYRDVMMVQAGANDALINKELETEIRTLAEKTKPQSTIKKINAIMDARTNLSHNAAPLLTVEALMCVLAR